MKRRKFITLLGGAAVWPMTVRAQPSRRLGILMGWAENDADSQTRLAAFRQAFEALGWREGANLRVDLRWSAGDLDRANYLAKELVSLGPDVILASTTPVTAALQRETKTIPIVFVAVSDPVGSGFVESLSHPGGNLTGFINLEATLGGKWLELLKEIAPRTAQVAVLFNPQTAPYAEYYLGPLRAAAEKLGVTLIVMQVQSVEDIQGAIKRIARQRHGSIIALTDAFIFVHRKLIIELTAQHKVPAIYSFRPVAAEGGLILYAIDARDLFARAAPYVDRVLRGTNPAELPVQVPTKFQFGINLKTAKALGLSVPPSLLARADEVIE